MSYEQNNGFNKILNKKRLKFILSMIEGDSCLEVGCGQGQITKTLSKHFKKLLALDNDEKNLNSFKSPKNVLKVCFDIEHFKLSHIKFDTIICTNVLEHLNNPDKALKNMLAMSHSKTKFIFVVPNANSYNRKLGVDMFFLKKTTDLDDGDKAVGHKRMYTLKSFSIFVKKHLHIITEGTRIYKPLPNSLMTKLSKKVIEELVNMPVYEAGAEIFAICKQKKEVEK